MKLKISIITLTLSLSLFGCFGSSEKASKVDEPVSTEVEKTTATSAAPVSEVSKPADNSRNSDELYLQQARLMTRMGEIESELKVQREKIRLLEQGLLTGIAPDALRNSRSERKPAGEDQSAGLDHLEDGALSAPDLQSVEEKMTVTQKDKVPASDVSKENQSAGLHEKLKLVQDLYQASRFGVAISELSAISREHGENALDGKIHLWLGKCYARLKEFTTARAELESYLKSWPSGVHVAEVRLELAKVYSGLGLKERARGELRRVMKDFSGQEPSEMASAEFNRMQGGL